MPDKILLKIFCSLILFSAALTAQDDKTLARAGGNKITSGEFIQRFEFSPHSGEDIAADEKNAKLNFLKTLIAEKLLAGKAISEGLDKSPEFVKAFGFTRNLYLRDALYNVEIKNKTTVPDSALANAKNKIGKTLTVKFIFSQNEKEINELYSALNMGASFDSILATRPENSEQKDTSKISFGMMNEKIEDRIYDLVPGQFTAPVELKEGWYICKVYSLENKDPADAEDFRKAERVLRQRQEDKNFETFYRNFFRGIKVNADSRLFERLLGALSTYIKSNEKKFAINRDKYSLLQNEINEVRKNLKPFELSAVFVKFSSYPVKLNSFLDYMGLQGFDFTGSEQVALRSRLNSVVSTFIQNELLAREAAKRGLDKLPGVAEDLNVWKDNYLATLYMKSVYKSESVSDDEAYGFFEKNNRLIPQPDEVKIAEILADDLDVVKTVLDELNRGVPFSDLARRYTIRDSLKDRGGEFDYQPVGREGEIWETAAKMKPGEIVGPIKTAEGYSVIKLIDRREKKKKLFGSFEEAKNSIKEILRTEKMYVRLDDVTAELAVENKVEINETLLNSIKVSTVNMLVFRRFGFGGQQYAVPYVPDFSRWYKTYENLKKKLSL